MIITVLRQRSKDVIGSGASGRTVLRCGGCKYRLSSSDRETRPLRCLSSRRLGFASTNRCVYEFSPRLAAYFPIFESSVKYHSKYAEQGTSRASHLQITSFPRDRQNCGIRPNAGKRWSTIADCPWSDA